MPNAKLDREGTFKALILDAAVSQSDSGAVMLNALFQPTACFDGTNWEDWSQFAPMEVWGNFCLVNKAGQANEINARALMAALNWDGNLVLLQETDWSQTEVQITVKQDTYNNEARFRAAFIRPVDAEPTVGLKKAAPGKLKELNAAFGAQFRALRPASAPAQAASARSAAPPAPQQIRPPAPQAAAPAQQDKIPW